MVREVLVAIGVTGVVLGPSPSFAIAQDAIDLSGTWQFDTELVQISQEGTAVRATFLEGADCLGGESRPFFLEGVLEGTALTGRMMVCSRSPRLVEECGISSLYETTFEATVEEGRIAGTRVAQGLSIEEEGGRYVRCVPDSRYDGTYDFAGSRSCGELELEREVIWERVVEETEGLNALTDVITATPGAGNWLEEDYQGPAADLVAEYQAKLRQLHEVTMPALWEAEARLAECQGACPGPDLENHLFGRAEALTAEQNAVGDELAAIPRVPWTEEGYAGLYADRAARWREVRSETNGVEALLAGSQDPGEQAALQSRLAALNEVATEIEDLMSPLNVTDWTRDDYVGPAAELAARWHALGEQVLAVLQDFNALQARRQECESAVG